MLTIWTNKIKHSTVGSSFSVTFSVAPNELEYLDKLYDCFSSMNWSSFPITADRKTENSSEKPNNCEHITEDGVTCAKYPACDDCPNNPLNKVKGSERLVKGKDEPQMGDAKPIPLSNRVTHIKDEPQTCEDCEHNGEKRAYDYACDKCTDMDKFQHEDEPQADEHCETCRHKDECEGATYEYRNTEWWCLGYAPIEDEPQYDVEEVAKDINRRVDMVKKEWEVRHIEPKTEPQTDCAWK